MSPSVEEEDVVVGHVKGPWGLRGDLKVEALTDFPARFSPGSIIFLEGQPARVERSRPIKGGFVVKLDAVNDRTAAESLRGRFLTIPQRELSRLPDGSYYHFQIIDMGVWNERDEYVGRVKEVLATGGNDVYVVVDGGQRELLVPALADVVVEVDVERNKMTVRLPEGLE